MTAIAEKHEIDLRTAALQFSSAPSAVTAVLAGSSRPEQVTENVASMNTEIPDEFWQELKEEQLIAESAPVPE
jgi:D-threo-aldose 1-dehydrogenase